MDQIRDIYNRDVYYPFLVYCEEHNYQTMKDLVKCPFSKLSTQEGISSTLLNRIKTTFYMYCKKHPEILKQAPVKKLSTSENIEPVIEDYFQQNADKLIHIAEVVKGTGNRYKRSDVALILEQAPWCKAVDKYTYFYAKQN